MWETVAQQVRAAGGEIRQRVRVVGVRMTDGRVASVQVRDEQSGQIEDVPCDFFLSSLPVRELVAMVEPPAPDNVRQVAAGLCYRDFLTVGLLLDRLHVLEKGQPPQASVRDNWIYVQDAGVRVGRIQIFNNWSPYLAADPEHTVWIGLEYFCNRTDDLWRAADGDLLDLAKREIEQIGFARAADVRDGCVLRMPDAYPAYFGTYDRFDEIRRWVNGVPNLFCIGRNGMHRYKQPRSFDADLHVGGRRDRGRRHRRHGPVERQHRVSPRGSWLTVEPEPNASCHRSRPTWGHP